MTDVLIPAASAHHEALAERHLDLARLIRHVVARPAEMPAPSRAELLETATRALLLLDEAALHLAEVDASVGGRERQAVQRALMLVRDGHDDARAAATRARELLRVGQDDVGRAELSLCFSSVGRAEQAHWYLRAMRRRLAA